MPTCTRLDTCTSRYMYTLFVHTKLLHYKLQSSSSIGEYLKGSTNSAGLLGWAHKLTKVQGRLKHLVYRNVCSITFAALK